ncbi:unnamed protein product [Litomosoides sigmodontis]|uniref:Uncharacterized protein n=2 Tax=Litomosoides sigmodontis TaxID=42156 RepID=A0A3P6ULJ3_LITSI|nr:unnamed protein product [Litomosoides sigmodontis]
MKNVYAVIANMMLRYFLRIFFLITCDLLSDVYSGFSTPQTMRFFHTVHNDFVIYGITQDCQLYFVEHMNYMLIKSLKVDRNNTYCYPNLVKLHLRQGMEQISLMLIMKQAMNRICTLPIEMPSLETVSNGQIFRVQQSRYLDLSLLQFLSIKRICYSIFTSLPYSACSYLRHNSFVLEPDLSFMDTTLSDIIYFINAKSVGSQWDIQQFRINKHGNLIAMEQFVAYHSQQGNHGGTEQFNHFIVELDLKRSVLYTFNRIRGTLLSECLFDLLFRPSHRFSKWIKFDEARHTQAWLESFAVDGQLMIFTESTRNEMGPTSELYLTNLRIRNSSTRLLHLDFVSDIGVLRKQTYTDLSTKNIPSFGGMRQLYMKSIRNTQLTMAHASTKHAVVNMESLTTLTLTVQTTSTSPIASAGRTTTISGIDRFYSEIENNRSDDTYHEIWKAKTQTTANPTTLLAQYVKHQIWSTEATSKENDIKESQLVTNSEQTRDITLSNHTVNEFWETSISEVDGNEQNAVFDIDGHVYDDEMKDMQGTADVFQFPQQVNPEKTETSVTADYSKTTSPPNTTLRSNCALLMMKLNIFVYLLLYMYT